MTNHARKRLFASVTFGCVVLLGSSLAGGCARPVAAVVGATTTASENTSRADVTVTDSPTTTGGSSITTVAGGKRTSGADGACGAWLLPKLLAGAVNSGSDVVDGIVSLTGRTMRAAQQNASGMEFIFSEVQVKVLARMTGGPVRASFSSWIMGGTDDTLGTSVSGGAATILPSDGHMIVIYSPNKNKAESMYPTVPSLIEGTPILDNRVVLSAFGCWPSGGLTSLQDLPASKFNQLGASGTQSVVVEGAHTMDYAEFQRIVIQVDTTATNAAPTS